MHDTDAAGEAQLVDLIHLAGNPFYDWLFADHHLARSVLADRVRSQDSEVSGDLVRTLVDAEGQVLGGYIGLGGTELTRRRSRDALAFLQAVEGVRRPGLIDRMRAGRPLFPDVGRDEHYLSKLGVAPSQRRRGFGQQLLNRFIADAVAAGARRARLDVSAANTSAIALYQSAGFAITAESYSADAAMTYYAMTRDVAAT